MLCYAARVAKLGVDAVNIRAAILEQESQIARGQSKVAKTFGPQREFEALM